MVHAVPQEKDDVNHRSARWEHFTLDIILSKVANSYICPVDFQSMIEVWNLLPHVVGGLLLFSFVLFSFCGGSVPLRFCRMDSNALICYAWRSRFKCKQILKTLNACERFVIPTMRLLTAHVNYVRNFHVLVFYNVGVGVILNKGR